MKAWLLWLGAGLLALPAQALQGAWVSWVMDGDTVLLVPQGDRQSEQSAERIHGQDGEREPVRLRIVGIDAPESCQSGGVQARDALMALVLRRTVQVEPHGQDSYGRQLGRLWLDGQDIGAEMVRSGWAWAYRYRTGRGPYALLQQQAQRGQKGLFAATGTAMSPALFRQFHGSCHPELEGQAPVRRAAHTGQDGSR